MNVQINLNNVSNFTLKGLVNDGVVKLETFNTDKIIDILGADSLWGGRICIVKVFERMDLTNNTKKEIFEKCICKTVSSFIDTPVSFFTSLDKNEFSKLFVGMDLFGINLTTEMKKVIHNWYMKYIVNCETHATDVSIHPNNLPDWLIKMMPNDYNGIQHRIAMYKAGNWMNYNPNNPDSRVQVRAAYADFAGTKKGQAIHDNAYSLRKRAVREHNLKLVSKKG